MTRLTIGHFRAVLAGRADANAAVRAYRELTRRPELAAGMYRSDWIPWGDVRQAHTTPA